MKAAGILAITALPGVAVGYLVLTGLILRRVQPLPITFVPQPSPDLSRHVPERAAA
ncbi:MAG TPA: hypothetical protein VLS25_05925 [Dehalococcoidia bacterium]|nr:hypothetical protein [Dehalococcoidia bacterium]